MEPIRAHDEAEVTVDEAASMLGITPAHVRELLSVEAIPHRVSESVPWVAVGDIVAYRRCRDQRAAAMREMADIVNESPGGWNR